MLGLLVKLHISSAARKQKIKCPLNMEEILQKKLETIDTEDNITNFSWLFDGGSKNLNACALVPGRIIINAEWAAHLVLLDKEETLNAFRQTIGHELTHKDNDFILREFLTKDKKFVNWINEVHADFGGAIKSLNSSRNKLVKAIEYKKRWKGVQDKSSESHPSWEKRLEYVTKFDFDEKLIRKVALDTECCNERLVEHVCKYFTDYLLE